MPTESKACAINQMCQNVDQKTAMVHSGGCTDGQEKNTPAQDVTQSAPLARHAEKEWP